LALDYLLASEGGVCEKFNLNNCCLQNDDEEKVIKEISDKIKKLAHSLCRPGRDRVPKTLFRDWFSNLGGFKKTLIGQCSLSWEQA
jgi:hypothetical protein